ncbi:RcnB family protein [Sphingomonas sp. SUN039]|uniref:RcnB family protein n=1 Tax=Sphingomonas sp. SUN039 TaxID=2937787 RepID=UPI00216425AF|nr:RcnB family protein [Sphingomonas sp. SUN039]UVO55067.1 RcnB family protein [Sphingomonas sp. SUN039]
MRKTIIAGLLAATLVPVAAQAQINPSERRELQRDRQDIRQERGDLNRAYRSGDPRAIRQESREYRGARQEYREDYRDARRDGNGNWGRDDWRQYRNHNRDLYRGYGWRSDNRYQSFRPGIRIGVGYYAPRYYINDYSRYRLPRPGFNQRWVRHYNDVLLIDIRSGYVIDVYRNFYW